MTIRTSTASDFPIPAAALANHTAVVGMTGSGKTSTEKLIVEHVVAQGHRVCILDTVKSDWWGITSSADGKRPGLPFRILGGPRGHVPLHSSAGKAIGQLVGSGKLPLSIIDMADFEAGGLQRFFVDFAQSLWKNVRGVVYLVIEEAHEVAPKERAGFGAENMAIHWAKKLATGSRTKGIRLIVATQRTQALHNAVLGSCQTLIAHQIMFGDDQEPVIRWVKNVNKSMVAEIRGTLASLPAGSAWVCSGRPPMFERIPMPKFATFDNTSTPDGDENVVDVKTAPVDHDELRAIIGDAVKEAEANDPKLLKAEIAKLQRQLAQRVPAAPVAAAPNPEALAKAETAGFSRGWAEGHAKAVADALPAFRTLREHADEIAAHLKTEQANLETLARTAKAPAPQPRAAAAPVAPSAVRSTPSSSGMPKVERAFLTVLAQRGKALTRNQVAIFSGYSVKSRHVDNTLGALRSKQWVTGGGDAISITDAGADALGTWAPLPTGEALRSKWLAELSKAEGAFLQVLIDAYPGAMTRDEVANATGYSATSRHVDNTLGRLRSLELATGPGSAITASEELFA